MNIVILAAGQGKRMKTTLPKVLHPVAGTSMLGHVLTAVGHIAESALPCVVVGHGSEQVQDYLSKNYPNVRTAVQSEQKGTGHAVFQASPFLSSDATTMILYGDVPLTQATTLHKMKQLASDGGLVVLTQLMENPTGYGRIERNLNGEVIGIVEEKDASPSQREIKEINTGMMACDTADLKRWLGLLQPNNAQGEYYLTDIIAFAAKEGVPIRTTQAQYDWEVQGVNSRAQLAALEREYQVFLAGNLLDNGVTLADPARIDIRGNFNCASDVTIDVGCVFEGNVEIAAGVKIGPYCVIKNATIGKGTQIHAYTHIEDATVANAVSYTHLTLPTNREV